MKHPLTIKKYEGNMPELTEDLGNLRYDALADFLKLLSQKIQQDGEKDRARGRQQLAQSLFTCSQKINEAAHSIDIAWKISAPYMSDNKETL